MNILWTLSAGILLATMEPLTSEPTNEWAVVMAGGEHVARAVADECNFIFNGRVCVVTCFASCCTSYCNRLCSWMLNS